MSHSETRLSVYLDDFELHVYNRSKLYGRLEKCFGLESTLVADQQEEEPKHESSRG